MKITLSGLIETGKIFYQWQKLKIPFNFYFHGKLL